MSSCFQVLKHHVAYLHSKRKTRLSEAHEHYFQLVDEVIGRKKQARPMFQEEPNALQSVQELRIFYRNYTARIPIKDYGAGSRSRTTHHIGGRQSLRRVSGIYRRTATSPQLGRLMYRLVRVARPSHLLELGTCLGISAAYQLAGIQHNQLGHLTTLEGAPALAQLSHEQLADLGQDRFEVIEGRFADTLPNLLAQHSGWDWVFIDGHHDPEATLKYFNMIYPKLEQPALVIFDDVNWSAGMIRFWQECKKDLRIHAWWDLLKWGVCLV